MGTKGEEKKIGGSIIKFMILDLNRDQKVAKIFNTEKKENEQLIHLTTAGSIDIVFFLQKMMERAREKKVEEIYINCEGIGILGHDFFMRNQKEEDSFYGHIERLYGKKV